MSEARDEPARWLAHATAGALRAAARLNIAALVLALVNVALAGIMAPTGTLWLVAGAVAALLAAAQLWLLVRVEVDRRLFDALALAGAAPDLAELDAALAALGWMPASRAGRPMAARARGASRFLTIAGVLMALQWLIAVVILLLR
ncbi:hypothetical protein [Cupriavidus agavae]|uniref:Uncharacterized protein n=1 Tax=Cupriavidus agavae TaxID=1001822 RepID=A0A4Q7RF47_9BURK|nr:hypothetical protein [Cupriavidus agavae]RZT31823.1 hypothetical protein EV147_4323 [Cupriavidus agavae]